METEIKIKKIGIDIDDSMIDFLSNFLVFYNKKYKTNFSTKDFKSYKYCEILGGTNESAVREVLEFCKTPEFDSIVPVEGCKEAIQLLSNKYSVYAITTRHPSLKQKTLDFFEKQFSGVQIPVYHTGDFLGGGKRKYEICTDFEIPIIIEDNGKYALECANHNMYSILFNKPWNTQIYHNKIIKINSWKEIPTIISSLEERLK